MTSQSESFSRLLVPVDSSSDAERAVPWARAIAGDSTEIILMEVVPVASAVRSIGGQVIGSAETIQAGYQQMAETELEALATKWFPGDDRVSLAVPAGDPGDQILSEAEKRDVDLIVMSSHGRGAIGRFVSGSVADRVARHAPAPVMVVGPERDGATEAVVRRIVTPVVDSELSLAALPVASQFARATGAPVEIVHVVMAPSDLAMTYPATTGMIPPIAFDDGHEQLVADGHALVERVARQLDEQGIDTHTTVLSGNPAHALLGDLQPGDIVVMASHQREGLARWVMGSTSLKLIGSGQAPVVIVTRDAMDRSDAPL